MKKKVIIVMVTVFFLMAFIISNQDKLEIASVFQEDSPKQGYILDVSKEDFTNLNMRTILNKYSIEIKRVYPLNKLTLIDSKITKELTKFYYYSDKSLYEQYHHILTKYGLYQDLERFMLQGFKIKGLVIKVTSQNLSKLKQTYPKIEVLNSEDELLDINN